VLCLERLRPPKAPCGNGTEALHTLLSPLCCFPRKKFKSSLSCDKFVDMQSTSSSPVLEESGTKYETQKFFMNLVGFDKTER